jgi:hypothetical protein
VLTKACEQCKASIDAHKGRLLVKEAARAVCSLPDPGPDSVLAASAIFLWVRLRWILLSH